MKRSLKNVVAMLLCGVLFWCVPVHADLIYSPMDRFMENIGVVIVVGGAIGLIVVVTISLLVYLKRTKKTSQSEDKGEKL